MCPFQEYAPPKVTSDFYHQLLVLPVIKLHINGVTQEVLFPVCLISISIMFLRFMHMLVCILIVCLFTAGILHHINASIFTHSPAERYLGSFQIGLLRIKLQSIFLYMTLCGIKSTFPTLINLH